MQEWLCIFVPGENQVYVCNWCGLQSCQCGVVRLGVGVYDTHISIYYVYESLHHVHVCPMFDPCCVWERGHVSVSISLLTVSYHLSLHASLSL